MPSLGLEPSSNVHDIDMLSLASLLSFHVLCLLIATSFATASADVILAAPAQNSGVKPEAASMANTSPSQEELYWSENLQSFMQSITFGEVVKILCLLGNVLVQVAPYPQVMRWQQRGCTGDADSAPYISIAFGGWQWCYYGAFAWYWTGKSGFMILVESNILGALLGTYYVFVYWRHCQREISKEALQSYLTAVTTLIAFQVCALIALPRPRVLFLTGLVSSFCSFLGAASLLTSVPAVLTYKDSKGISAPLVISNFFCAVVWSICGFRLEDPLIMMPNGFTILACLLCMYLKLAFPSYETDAASEVYVQPSKPTTKILLQQLLKPSPSEYTPLFSIDTGGQESAGTTGGTF